jgi:arginase family enzyme
VARFAVVDAPLDCSGTGRGEERAPAALRAAGLVERLGARDAGEAAARIRDTRRDRDTGVVGAAELRRASKAIAARVREVLAARERPLVLGGDCALLLGVFQALPPGSGLWFVDGHADFLDGQSSPTGEAADMELAILTGHGPPALLE